MPNVQTSTKRGASHRATGGRGERQACDPVPVKKRVRPPEHSGRSYQIQLVSPPEWKPVKSGNYKVTIVVEETKFKKKIIITLRDRGDSCGVEL